MPKIDQLNETLRKEIASVISEELDFSDGLITIMAVECDTNFYSATIYFSVLPDSLAGTALDKLKKNSGFIAEELKKRVKMRKMPHLIWRFDPTERNAGKLDKIFDKINEEIDTEEMEDIKYEN